MFKSKSTTHSLSKRTDIASGKRLNLGCGRHFHSDWVNVDLVACSPEVIEADLTQGIPFPEATFEAVYHSHVLEHMDQEAGRKFLGECFRVLAPGGTLRVAVPDLERIARDYVQALDEASRGSDSACQKHEWLKLELLDQLVRTQSGGKMGIAMRDAKPSRRSMIAERMGGEVLDAQAPLPQVAPKSFRSKYTKRFAKLRDRVVRSLLKRLYGRAAVAAWDESQFRASGEIHRWMYDRVDLARTLSEVGFESVKVCEADESRISGFVHCELDTRDGRVRKPDSLFVEATKPSQADELHVNRRQVA